MKVFDNSRFRFFRFLCAFVLCAGIICVVTTCEDEDDNVDCKVCTFPNPDGTTKSESLCGDNWKEAEKLEDVTCK